MLLRNLDVMMPFILEGQKLQDIVIGRDWSARLGLGYSWIASGVLG